MDFESTGFFLSGYTDNIIIITGFKTSVKMPSAFVLVSCEIDGADLLAAELKKLPGLEYSVRVSGAYDFFVKVNSETDEELKKIIMGIRANNSVRSSLTLMIVKTLL